MPQLKIADAVLIDADSDDSSRRARLGDWLVSHGYLTTSDVDSALAEQRVTGDPLGGLLVARGVIGEEELSRALAGIFDLPFRDLVEFPPDPKAVARLPQNFCRRRGVLPVAFDGTVLLVAISDPADVLTLDDAQVVAGTEVDAVITGPGQLQDALDQAFSPGSALYSGARSGRAAATSAAGVEDASKNDVQVAGFVENLLDRAVAERASDVHIEPNEGRLRFRLRVDGVMHDATDLSPSVPTGVVNRIKILAGLDIAEHRRPQDGRMSFESNGRPIDARIATLPTSHGEALTLRLLDRDHGLLNIDTLGFEPDALHRLRLSYGRPWGLILAVGPTGSGKSTTIYSILSKINEPNRNIVTVEDPVEYDIPGIKQTQVHTKIDYTFAAGLRAILRADPDVIVVGEIRDTETAHTAAKAALTGHLVLSTLHANDAATAIARLLEMNLEPYLVASSLTCVVAQRLVRRLCLHCKVAYTPGEDERLAIQAMLPASAGGVVPHDLTVFGPGGCRQCDNNGYRGRSAVYEVMVVTARIRTLILEQASAAVIEEAAVAEGTQRLRENGIDKVLAGTTSFAELNRCIV
ncbi:MAG TPA: ATPase, T2SS/T4P/T4SS family [Acidimicrobiales bacterium]|nr:ATPase, T2SS/T4P/T4SS family [Acidimicrobiales bacterium]